MLILVESLILQRCEFFPLLGRQHFLDLLAVPLTLLALILTMRAAQTLKPDLLHIAQI